MKTRTCVALTMVLALSLGTYLPEAAAAPKAINSCQTITRSGPLLRSVTTIGRFVGQLFHPNGSDHSAANQVVCYKRFCSD